MAEPISQTNTPTIVANVDKGLASGNASFWENAARLNSATPLNAAESPEAFKVYQDIQQNPGRFISNTFDNFSGYEKSHNPVKRIVAVSCFVHFFCAGRGAWDWAVCPTGHLPERMAEFAEHGQSP